MAYNLTQRQKNILRWFVQESRSQHIPEEFFVIFYGNGLFDIADIDFLSDPPKMIKSDLYLLSDNHLVRLQEKYAGTLLCSINQAGYDAVDHEFVEPVPPSTIEVNIRIDRIEGDNNKITGIEHNH